MEHLLKEARARAPFLVTWCAVLALVVVLYILVADLTQWDAIKAILQSIATTLVASLFIALMILLYLPSGSEVQELSLVEAQDISRLLRSAAQTSRSWLFSGGSGRFLRATTLPALLKTARDEHVSITLRAVLYDPENDQLCDRYATYRRDSASELGENAWTTEKVRLEILATLFELYRARQMTDALDLQIALTETMSVLRYDISDRYAVATTEGKEAPAVRADVGTHYYETYRRVVHDQIGQGREIKIVKDGSANTAATAEAVSSALTSMGFGLHLSDALLAQIASTAHAKVNPYR